jgi:hypothetical protein
MEDDFADAFPDPSAPKRRRTVADDNTRADENCARTRAMCCMCGQPTFADSSKRVAFQVAAAAAKTLTTTPPMYTT